MRILRIHDNSNESYFEQKRIIYIILGILALVVAVSILSVFFINKEDVYLLVEEQIIYTNYGFDENHNQMKSERIEYEYDQNGHMKKQYIYRDDVLKYIDEYICDDLGNALEKTRYNIQENSTEKRIVYDYDKKNNLTEEKRYSVLGQIETLEAIMSYEYDKHNNMIKIVEYYDNYMDDVIEMEEVNVIEFEIDDNGNRIKEYWYQYDSLVTIADYVYNDKNQLTLTSLYYEDGDEREPIQDAAYAYDSFGNLIEVVNYENGEVINVKTSQYRLFE